MLCYQCQGTGFLAGQPGWPCPLCNGQRVLGCCDGDVEQPDPSVDHLALSLVTDRAPEQPAPVQLPR